MLKQKYNVDVIWHAYEMRPAGSPPMDPRYQQYIETTARPRFNQMMREQHGIEPNPGPFGILTRLPLIGEKVVHALAGQAAADRYHDAVTRAYWTDAMDISDLAVLRPIAESLGLDGEQFTAALSDPAYEREVLTDVHQAQQIGIQGVPALIFDRKYYVSGAQPLDLLAEVVERVQAENPKE